MEPAKYVEPMDWPDLINRNVLVPVGASKDKIMLRCTVRDVRNLWGRTHVLLVPVSASGKMWIQTTNVTWIGNEPKTEIENDDTRETKGESAIDKSGVDLKNLYKARE